jgi:hypothetical protein
MRVCAQAALPLAGVAIMTSAASAPPRENSASGAGTIEIHRDHGEAIGTFDFTVTKRGSRISGRMEYGAEDHGGAPATYPHIIVRVNHIESASFRGNEVRFTGEGWLQGETVDVEVTAIDGVAEDDADRFLITCTDSSGVVYEAEGSVVIGSINFGS